MELLDGSRLISKDKRALSDTDAGHTHPAGAHEEESGGGARHARSVNMHEAGFIQYLDTGIWHLAFYNDGRNTEQVSYNTIIIGETRELLSVHFSMHVPFNMTPPVQPGRYQLAITGIQIETAYVYNVEQCKAEIFQTQL